MSRPAVVAGNWKMHGSLAAARDRARAVAAGLDGVACEALLCPPFVHLPAVLEAAAGTRLAVGAQNVCARAEGAHTGEVSAAMLAELGCAAALIGHSERRRLYREGDADVAAKFARLHELAAADERAPRIVLCVGETLAEREAGRAMDALRAQLAVAGEHPGAFPRARIAYEPVWAIGTGRTAAPELAQEAHAGIRARLREMVGAAADDTAILYGGSIRAANAAALFAMPDIDGGLVGGASLAAGEFLDICRAVPQ